jgi:hypothetical protein
VVQKRQQAVASTAARLSGAATIRSVLLEGRSESRTPAESVFDLGGIAARDYTTADKENR